MVNPGENFSAPKNEVLKSKSLHLPRLDEAW